MASAMILCANCGAQNAQSEVFCFSCGYALTASSSAATASSTLTGQLPAQTLLKQRYQILQRIGKGGMGAVYHAEDTSLGNRAVAIKEMGQGNGYGQQVQEARENFQQEAHLLAGLQHPNLPSIHDYFEENGRWYLVMSFIQGETLEEYLSRAHDQKLSLEETLRIGQELCNVLHYLHTHQPPIIFRDLKPSNIMCTADGHIYLIDFGIARHFKPGQAKDTASYGSAGYAPPEQYGRAQTTERSDIYSLGATLYQLLSGYDPSQSPFRFPLLQSLVPTLPKRLVELITQMVEMDVSKRPENIKVVEQELHQVSGPAATIEKASKWRTLKSAAPKQQASVLTPTSSTSVPAPASAGPTQYAAFTPPAPNQHTPSPSAPTQYAPPPAAHPSTQVPQIYAQPLPVSKASSTPVQHPAIRKTLVLFGKILSIIGMIIGATSILMGILELFVPFGIVSKLWFCGLFVFFGLMIFFIAHVRESSVPVSRARKTEATIGKVLGIIGIIAGIIITILGAIMNRPGNDDGGGIIAGVLIVIMSVVIWPVTRIRIKKTP